MLGKSISETHRDIFLEGCALRESGARLAACREEQKELTRQKLALERKVAKERSAARNRKVHLEFEQNHQEALKKEQIDPLNLDPLRAHLKEEERQRNQARKEKDDQIIKSMPSRKRTKCKTRAVLSGSSTIRSHGSTKVVAKEEKKEPLERNFISDTLFYALVQETPFQIWTSIVPSLQQHQCYEKWKTMLLQFRANNYVFGRRHIVKLKNQKKSKRNYYELRDLNLDVRLIGRRWTFDQMEKNNDSSEVQLILQKIRTQINIPTLDSFLWFDLVAEKHNFISATIHAP